MHWRGLWLWSVSPIRRDSGLPLVLLVLLVLLMLVHHLLVLVLVLIRCCLMMLEESKHVSTQAELWAHRDCRG